MSKKIKFTKDFSYPEPEDQDLLSKIFKKREFYYYRVPEREKMETYEDVQKYRSMHCKKGEIEPREQQAILPNFMSPNTPYKGVILMHGVGSGKTMSAIRVAEQFKDQVKKYNTKIYVLVPGPNTRENFKKELLNSTGETYLKNKEALNQMTKQEIEREKKSAIYGALQYYKILSYKTFYKKVLGEKIVEKKIVGDSKIKSSYRKTADGEYERELVVDRITNMNNAILIVDEAHNISGNEYGEALKKIIKNSENLRVILLTATPMINLADEIVDLLNFIRPLNDQVQRDKIFTSEKNYSMKIKSTGLEYLKEKARGYISFYRGSIPYTFAKRIDKGVIPSGMLFTPVIKCFMEPFQYNTYIETTQNFDDTLDRASSAASNFVFPGLNKDKTDLAGYYSTEGMNTVISQLNTDGAKLRGLINKKIFGGKLSKGEEENFIFENDKKNITGLILKLPYLKKFSTKFHTIFEKISKLVEGEKGSSTAFIYSNLVKAGGMELFAETLIQNGYLEYQEDSANYDIKDETIDYKTGFTYLDFKKKKMIMSEFKPTTFLLVTGGADESGEDVPEIKQKIIQDVFNSPDNSDGKYVKFILGSRVMNEGVTLKNCKEVHIIDVFFNIPKVEQVIGRAIRMCVHQDVINDNYKYPEVSVFRYVVAINDKKQSELSTDEILYQKAELKYLTVKEIERALKETAIDCPLLLHANMFPEDLAEYKNCVSPTLENVNAGKQICPSLCDFKKCDLKCDATKLNEKYWDSKKNTYRKLTKDEINYNTFNDDLAKYEIALIKNRIKDLYRFKHVYMYNEILEEIKKSFQQNQAELFEDYFLNQALEDMMPRSENDFNNYKDAIYDKYNRSGYLIQRGKYYIFQPFNENEDVPMYYRQHLEIEQNNQVSLNNFVKQKFHSVYKNVKVQKEETKVEIGYNFDDTFDYYEDREENFIVGIIDKNLNKLASDEPDLFKIRPPRAKVLDKKRGTGIPTFKGAVCSTSKDKEYLMKLIRMIPNITKTEIARIDKLIREQICLEIRDKLLFLEKYSTTKDGNKITYMMIPSDHPIYQFPYNLEDRIKYKMKQVNKLAGHSIDILTKKQKDKNDNAIYELTFNNEKYFKDSIKELEEIGFKLKDNVWTMILN